MNYGEIVSLAFNRAWRYKSLWLLGFLTVGISTFNIGQGNDSIASFEEFLLRNPFIILSVVAFVLILGLVYFILRIIAEGALIDAAGRFRRNEPYRLGLVWQTGMACFWPMLGAAILFIIMILAFVLVLILIGVMTFLIAQVLGYLSLLILAPIFLAGLFVWVMTYMLAQRMIVLEHRPVMDSIGDSFAWLTQALGINVIMFFISLGIMIGFAIISALILAVVALPFITIGLFNLWLALLIGVPTAILIMYLVNGYVGAAVSLMMTEFYFRLERHLHPAVEIAAPTPEPGSTAPDEPLLPPAI
ncbi:MAG: hypothetical protein PHR28_03230 [candidate division Zixibacteria bacterium]|nr:hypothetical protein [candidate division Zixibacteria bacterium]